MVYESVVLVGRIKDDARSPLILKAAVGVHDAPAMHRARGASAERGCRLHLKLPEINPQLTANLLVIAAPEHFSVFTPNLGAEVAVDWQAIGRLLAQTALDTLVRVH